MCLVGQSCLTLYNPMDCSPPGSSIHGILQARTLEWVAVSFSRGSSWPRNRTGSPTFAGGFFTVWATRKALQSYESMWLAVLRGYSRSWFLFSQISLSYLPLFLPYGPGHSSDRSRHFLFFLIGLVWASLVAQTVKNLPRVWYLSQEDSRRREWQPTPVLLPGEFHGQRSLVGCSPWGRKESDTLIVVWLISQALIGLVQGPVNWIIGTHPAFRPFIPSQCWCESCLVGI